MDMIIDDLGIELWRIPVVVISAIGIYLGFMLLVKIFGSRVLSSMTASDAVVVIMFGAVGGRVILGHPPTLATGLIGLLSLMLLEASFGSFRRFTGWGRQLDRQPVLVVAHGHMLRDQMRHSHVSRTDVFSAMRRAGIGSLEQIQAMVLEPTGTMSVIREGQLLQVEAFRGLRGCEELGLEQSDASES
ncbi:DUF421 domain-containing protein [Corynebacterium alimapuense]